MTRYGGRVDGLEEQSGIQICNLKSGMLKKDAIQQSLGGGFFIRGSE